MKKTINSILFYIFIIIIITSFVFAVIDRAQGNDKIKTKEENYFENKGCTLTKEKFKDKTLDVTVKARVFEVNCNGTTWNVMVYKEKLV